MFVTSVVQVECNKHVLNDIPSFLVPLHVMIVMVFKEFPVELVTKVIEVTLAQLDLKGIQEVL